MAYGTGFTVGAKRFRGSKCHIVVGTRSTRLAERLPQVVLTEPHKFPGPTTHDATTMGETGRPCVLTYNHMHFSWME